MIYEIVQDLEGGSDQCVLSVPFDKEALEREVKQRSSEAQEGWVERERFEDDTERESSEVDEKRIDMESEDVDPRDDKEPSERGSLDAGSRRDNGRSRETLLEKPFVTLECIGCQKEHI